MRQLQSTRRRAARPTSSEPEPLLTDLRTSSHPPSGAAVDATLAHIDQVLCATT